MKTTKAERELEEVMKNAGTQFSEEYDAKTTNEAARDLEGMSSYAAELEAKLKIATDALEDLNERGEDMVWPSVCITATRALKEIGEISENI